MLRIFFHVASTFFASSLSSILEQSTIESSSKQILLPKYRTRIHCQRSHHQLAQRPLTLPRMFLFFLYLFLIFLLYCSTPFGHAYASENVFLSSPHVAATQRRVTRNSTSYHFLKFNAKHRNQRSPKIDPTIENSPLFGYSEPEWHRIIESLNKYEDQVRKEFYRVDSYSRAKKLARSEEPLWDHIPPGPDHPSNGGFVIQPHSANIVHLGVNKFDSAKKKTRSNITFSGTFIFLYTKTDRAWNHAKGTPTLQLILDFRNYIRQQSPRTCFTAMRTFVGKLYLACFNFSPPTKNGTSYLLAPDGQTDRPYERSVNRLYLVCI